MALLEGTKRWILFARCVYEYYVYVRMRICMYAGMYGCVFVYTCIYTNIFTNMHVWTYIILVCKLYVSVRLRRRYKRTSVCACTHVHRLAHKYDLAACNTLLSRHSILVYVWLFIYVHTHTSTHGQPSLHETHSYTSVPSLARVLRSKRRKFSKRIRWKLHLQYFRCARKRSRTASESVSRSHVWGDKKRVWMTE